jgi:purine-nucleoside phosphorylase
MVIEDHINLTGDNPLKGPNLSELGPRFPDMSDAYSKRLISKIKAISEKLDIELQYGVYAGIVGPSYETPAEIRMLRILGGDAVGMSTIAETIVANHFGVEVLGLSCITNLGAGMSSAKLTHQEVMENIHLSVAKLKKLLKEYITT